MLVVSDFRSVNNIITVLQGNKGDRRRRQIGNGDCDKSAEKVWIRSSVEETEGRRGYRG